MVYKTKIIVVTMALEEKIGLLYFISVPLIVVKTFPVFTTFLGALLVGRF
jgi:hypothetical protein